MFRLSGQGRQLPRDRCIDPGASERCNRVADTPVHERDAVHLHHRRPRAQPQPVLGLGLERDTHLQEAQRHLLQEQATEFGLVEGALLGLGSAGRRFQGALVDELAQLGRVGPRKFLDLPCAQVAQVAHQAHQLVVAEQREYATPGPLGVALEPSEQVHHASRMRPAIQHVPGLNQDGASTDPAIASVDDLRFTKDGSKGVISPVHVANGHDAFARSNIAERIRGRGWSSPGLRRRILGRDRSSSGPGGPEGSEGRQRCGCCDPRHASVGHESRAAAHRSSRGGTRRRSPWRRATWP